MSNINIKAQLLKVREKFRSAEPAQTMDSANRNVFDGTYTANLSLIEFDVFGKHPIIRFVFTITDSDKKSHESSIGERVETRYNLDTDEGPSFVKRDFGRFGYDEVDGLLDDIVASEQLFVNIVAQNPVCKIAVAMNDDDQWQNVFLNAVCEMNEEEELVKKEQKPEPTKSTKTSVSKLNELLQNENKKEKQKTLPIVEEKEEEEVVEEEQEEQEEILEEEVDLTVNSNVTAEFKGSMVYGIVKEIDESNDTVVIKLKDTGKLIRVKSEKVSLVV